MRETSRRSSTTAHGGITARLMRSCFVAVCTLAAACAGEKIAVGTSSAEVIKQLGAPDRIKTLRGKVLEDVADLAQAEQSKARVVFIYDRDQVRIWFEQGRVTRVARGSPPSNETAAPPPAN